MTGDQAFP